MLQGQTLGKYRVLDPLGRGGMARVYRAYHPQLDRYVAIKVLRPDLVEDGEFLLRFQREARAVAALRHPHIIHVYDFDVQDDVYYMVMELLEGDTLKARLGDYAARDERMPEGEIVRVLLDVLDGLAYAHSENMIHRDIKPANIMLTKRGQAVITDFGIAQIVGGTRYTVSGALMGTLNYMAPEQGLSGRCDPRSDIYSLGIVLYEMLTQSVPFDADTPLAILMKHLNDPLPLPHDLVPTISEPLERVVLKALSKAPESRFSDANEMAAALYDAVNSARIDLPGRISMPRSFPSPETSGSVAVLSGTERGYIGDVEFAADETDTSLSEKLALEQATEAAAPPAAASQATDSHTAPHVRAAPEHLPRLVSPTPVAQQATPGPLLGATAITLASTGAWVAAKAPGVARFLEAEIRGQVTRGILSAVGLVVVYNLFAVWVGGLTRSWGLFDYGWPIEFLVISLGLFVIMYANGSIWLLIPGGILLGNGILFAYCQITGNWIHWSFLWPLEPLAVGGSIWLAIWLSRRRETARRLARPLGCALGIVALAWIVLAAVGALLVDAVSHLIR